MKNANISIICELKYLRNIYFDFMEMFDCDKTKMFILTMFSLYHFKLHVKIEMIAIKWFAMNDLTEPVSTCEPFWLTWEGVSWWETFLDETFQPNKSDWKLAQDRWDCNRSS